jgi:hypothetical protein
VTGRGNQAQFYWQASAAGLVLGMALGLATGTVLAVYVAVTSSGTYLSLALALPLLGVLIGAVCGGAAGIAGTAYTSYAGRLPHALLTATAAVVVAAAIGALFGGFSLTGAARTAALAAPAALVLGLALPQAAERFRRPRPRRDDDIE